MSGIVLDKLNLIVCGVLPRQDLALLSPCIAEKDK